VKFIVMHLVCEP